jgi:hypothetical protein
VKTSGVPALRNPTTGITVCCARAVNGHAAVQYRAADAFLRLESSSPLTQTAALSASLAALSNLAARRFLFPRLPHLAQTTLRLKYRTPVSAWIAHVD